MLGNVENSEEGNKTKKGRKETKEEEGYKEGYGIGWARTRQISKGVTGVNAISKSKKKHRRYEANEALFPPFIH